MTIDELLNNIEKTVDDFCNKTGQSPNVLFVNDGAYYTLSTFARLMVTPFSKGLIEERKCDTLTEFRGMRVEHLQFSSFLDHDTPEFAFGYIPSLATITNPDDWKLYYSRKTPFDNRECVKE